MSKRVKKRIDDLGFSTYGIVNLQQMGPAAGKGLDAFIAKHYHGQMNWMEDTKERRSHPKNLWPLA
ncbi:MAG: tRNA epoxyqueuosine(34) reductase QueG, partial [Robiginitomaculum sp.]|nr:tRNA epoxyqueuosine(34) reductase QueG [Robiginitomaculum sp.]